MRRRTFLQRSSVLAALGLAGCTGDDQGSTETAPPATDTRSATPDTGPGTTSAAGTQTPSPTQTATTASETDSPTPTPTPTETPTPTATPRPAVDQEVKVGPGALSFEPASFEIPTGGSVRWIWESSGHNVRPSNTPGGSDWSGTEGGDGTTFDAGYTYAYTFEVSGNYEYYCAPHRSAGMTGSFTVG